MAAKRKNKQREERIIMEIIVDAYGPEEQAMGWYYYLEGALEFPFTARCIAERAISPLLKGDEVVIVGMAGEEECQHEMFVTTPWERRTLAIPLSQVNPISVTDAKTKEAVEDWHYWVAQGYEL
jgi:Calcium binding